MTPRERLVELLRELSFERKRVTLASGRESDFFIDCKQTVLTAEGHALVGELMFAALDGLPQCAAVAGVELGGCPLASAVSLVSFVRGRPLAALYVRKDAKDHGSRKLVEGDRALRPRGFGGGAPIVTRGMGQSPAPPGGAPSWTRGSETGAVPVVILEDVITTGGSTLKAVEKLRAAGAEVVGVVALVDRLEGGAEAIREAGLPLLSICSRRDFLSDSE